ncbi:MAG: hypothetical protein ACKOHI_11805 [Phycisphaerales bacterium]
MPRALLAVSALLALAAPAWAQDWAALVRDPAARVRWLDADRVEVTPSHGGAPRTVSAPERASAVANATAVPATQAPRSSVLPEPSPPSRAAPDPPPLPAAAAALAGPHAGSPDRTFGGGWGGAPGQEPPVHAVESAPADRIEPKLRTRQYLKPGDRIERRWPRLFRADGPEVPIDRASFAEPWSNDDLRWSADSRRFTFLHNARGHQLLRLVSVDADTGAVRTVVEERALIHSSSSSPSQCIPDLCA